MPTSSPATAAKSSSYCRRPARRFFFRRFPLPEQQSKASCSVVEIFLTGLCRLIGSSPSRPTTLQKQMIPRTLGNLFPPLCYQALARGDSGRFLEGFWRARQAVPVASDSDLRLLSSSSRGGTPKMGTISVVVGQLKKALGKAEQEVQRFTAALAALGSSHSNGRRTLSAAARNRISLAQKKRWATARKESKPAAAAAPAKRTMSTSARRKIAAAQKKRWVLVRAGQKKAA